ncbi:hypothetical protein BK133_28750 [Paenibacillus sp. FSL H8-0548]|uniref:hypothetical protein n=1 Tax=Paenibacillus sp. FSL H8-0548 TaxID=1920422 RepID=UPI00096D7E2A|nr:hypothetical protein [Paenibacillus sp. FSL H8-0548]OMF21170.1 hypothetical protein BK133_28750 [Paenibacillus sp. FSL H8-0548]
MAERLLNASLCLKWFLPEVHKRNIVRAADVYISKNGATGEGLVQMRWIPAARSNQWWLLAGASSLLVSILLWIIRFLILGQPFTGLHAFRFMVLAVVLSFLFSFTGWLGARKLWLLSNIGMFIGLVLMAMYSRNMTGWEDLISLLVFLEAVAAGVAAGLLVEGAYLILKLTRRK